MVFLYDESNNVDCIWYNGDKYYLIRNSFGDVVQLRDESNAVVAYYKYNAFGYLLSVTDANGAEITDTSHIAHLNPIRYRGYYYDAELKMYYLYSRYYNPEMCRFISADVVVGTSLAGTNLFAYCYNDPVNHVDPSGCLPDDRLLQNAQACKNGTGAFNMLGCYHNRNHNHSLDGATESPTESQAEEVLPQSTSDDGLDFIMKHEGFVGHVYDDGFGNLTIGYGHVLQDGENFADITQAEAAVLFRQDIIVYENQVNYYLDLYGVTSLNQHQYDALVSLTYNTWSGTVVVLDAMMSSGSIFDAFVSLSYASGQFVQGLYNRRVDEWELFNGGNYG